MTENTFCSDALPKVQSMCEKFIVDLLYNIVCVEGAKLFHANIWIGRHSENIFALALNKI
jgi:hypothetical protein